MVTLPHVKAKPYQLNNTIQFYEWGTRGPDAYIPRLLGFEPEGDTPYAELWLGAHPKAASRVVVENEYDGPADMIISLSQWLAAYPDDILGPQVAARYGGQFPFLTKVLSAGTSLSIQAHPDKNQAERLHAQDPEHYGDDNHKPEISVALDGLDALMGFKPYDQILDTLERYPELGDFLGETMMAHMHAAADRDTETQSACVHAMFNKLIKLANKEPDEMAEVVDALVRRLSGGASSEQKPVF